MKRADISDFQVLQAYVWAKEANRLLEELRQGPGVVQNIVLPDGTPIDMADRRSVFPYDVLMAVFPGCPFKVAWAAMDRACGRDLIEYGVNLRWGWLTDKGKDLWRSKQQ
jgi:hypothetical protein